MKKVRYVAGLGWIRMDNKLRKQGTLFLCGAKKNVSRKEKESCPTSTHSSTNKKKSPVRKEGEQKMSKGAVNKSE
jgi:hypothetical protein